MSSSTLDSRWATPVDRKKADEGLPATQYTAALKVNKDLHPETTASPSSSSLIQPSSSLGSRWATPHDTYKTERGLPATKYSESLTNAPIDFHPRQQTQTSVKWGNQGYQPIRKDEQSWWDSPSNNGNGHQDPWEDNKRNNSKESFSQLPSSSTNSTTTTATTATTARAIDSPNRFSRNNNNYSNNNYSNYANNYTNNNYNNHSNNNQQRSQGTYSPSRQQYQRGDTESSWCPSSPVPNQRSQLQQTPQQYEPISARPWNLIAMKKKEEKLTSPISYATAPNGSSSQPYQENIHDPSASFWNQEIEDKVLEAPITSFKSYKEWSEEQRQKSTTYVEGNELLAILLKGDCLQDERFQQNEYDKNIDYSNLENNKTSMTESNHGTPQYNDTIANEILNAPSEWGSNAKKSWDEPPTPIVQRSQQRMVQNDHCDTSNVSVNYNEQRNRTLPSVQSLPSSNSETQNYPNTPLTASSLPSTVSSTWDPSKKPWDDEPVALSSYNTTPHTSNCSLQTSSTYSNNNQNSMASQPPTWNSQQPSQRDGTLNNSMSNHRAQPLVRSESSSSWNLSTSQQNIPTRDNNKVENYMPPPPIMRSASSSGVPWDPNAPKPWDDPAPKPLPLNTSQQHNTFTKPIASSPSQYVPHMIEKLPHSNSNLRGTDARKSWSTSTPQVVEHNNSSWDRSTGSRSIYDVQNSDQSEYKVPTQRQSWHVQNIYSNGENTVRSATGERPWDADRYRKDCGNNKV